MAWDLATQRRLNHDPEHPCLQPDRIPHQPLKPEDPYISALKEEALGNARRQGVKEPWVHATIGDGQVVLKVYEGPTGSLMIEKEVDIADSRYDRL